MFLILGTVGIQALYGSLGEEHAYILFDHLRTEATVADIEGVALGADLDGLSTVAAVVADHLALTLVEGQGYRTVGTLHIIATAFAVEKIGKSPSVEKQDHLLLTRKDRLHLS